MTADDNPQKPAMKVILLLLAVLIAAGLVSIVLWSRPLGVVDTPLSSRTEINPSGGFTRSWFSDDKVTLIVRSSLPIEKVHFSEQYQGGWLNPGYAQVTIIAEENKKVFDLIDPGSLPQIVTISRTMDSRVHIQCQHDMPE